MRRFYVNIWESGDYDAEKPGTVVVVLAKDESDAEYRALADRQHDVSDCISEVPRGVKTETLRAQGMTLVGFPEAKPTARPSSVEDFFDPRRIRGSRI